MTTHYEIQGEGEPLLPLHGFTGAGADWRHIFQEPAAESSGGALTLCTWRRSNPPESEALVLVSAAHNFPPQARVIMGQVTVESRTEEEWAVMRQRHVQGDDQIRTLWTQVNAMKDSAVESTPPSLDRICGSFPAGGHGPISGERSDRFRETALAFVRDHP